MRRCKTLALVLALVLLLGACDTALKKAPENPIRLYYCRAEGNYSSETGALSYETVDLGEDATVTSVLARYLQGPADETLVSPFPAGLSCTKTEQDGEVLTLSFNEALATLSGVDLTLSCACLTMTLTQIPGIDAIRVAAPGTAIAAQTDVVLRPSQFLLFDEASYHPERAVTLYYVGRADGLLYPAQHNVTYSSGDQLPLLALQMLLSSDETYGDMTCIPAHTQVIDLTVSDGVCSLVLSEGFSDCDRSAQKAVCAVRQIVATLCAFDTIYCVNLSLLDGSTLQNVDLSQSLSPEPDWFYTP